MDHLLLHTSLVLPERSIPFSSVIQKWCKLHKVLNLNPTNYQKARFKVLTLLFKRALEVAITISWYMIYDATFKVAEALLRWHTWKCMCRRQCRHNLSRHGLGYATLLSFHFNQTPTMLPTEVNGYADYITNPNCWVRTHDSVVSRRHRSAEGCESLYRNNMVVQHYPLLARKVLAADFVASSSFTSSDESSASWSSSLHGKWAWLMWLAWPL